MKLFRKIFELTGLGTNLKPIFDWCVATDPTNKDIEVSDRFLRLDGDYWSRLSIKIYDRDLYNLFMLVFSQQIYEDSPLPKATDVLPAVKHCVFLYTIE